MTKTYDIGIVIVSYNVRHFLSQCLQSIYNSQTKGLNIGIWVIDNASIDGSAEYVSSAFPHVHLIKNEQNVGFSAANNQGIKEMDTQYVLLLNPDTVIEENTLQKCYDFMESHEDSGALGVRMIDGSGKFLPESKRKVPDLWSSFCKLSYLSDIFPKSRWFSGYYLGHLSEFETHQIEVLCGAFMFIRNSVLDAVGLLDEEFFMYGEDIDLSYRILRDGWKIHYFPETSIIHYKGESTKKASLNYIKTFYGAMSIYVNKHYSSGNAQLFAKFINIAIFFRAVLSGMGRLFKGVFWPLFDFGVTYFSLTYIKNIWAQYYFNNEDYYDNSPISTLLIFYLTIWIIALWLGGHYDKSRSIIQSIQSVLMGTVVILIFYALLPAEMRTSRILIFMGAVMIILISWLSSKLNSYNPQAKKNEETPLHLGIVADKVQAQRLTNLWISSNECATQFSYIAPLGIENDAFYTNSFKNLPQVVEKLKIDEVIFSSDSVSMKDIIHTMTHIHKNIKYHISSSDSLVVLGSHDKNTKGEWLNLDMKYTLSSPVLKRIKRVFDFMTSLILIPLFPLLFILTGFKFHFLSNIMSVLLGEKTWIGYSGDLKDFGFLPKLPPAVISYPHTPKLIHFEKNYFKTKNTEYAQTYHLFRDVILLIKNIEKISD